MCGNLKRKHARIWPLPIHRVARTKLQGRESVDIRWDNFLRKLWRWSLRRRWKTRDGKDVCCGPDGKTTSWVGRAGIFAWLSGWACAPTHTVAGGYGNLWTVLSTRVYASYKTCTSDQINTLCRMCGTRKVPESHTHVLAGCSSLAQTKYMDRHNSALRCCSLTCCGASSLPTLFLLTGGAQTVVLVSRRSNILECSGLRRTHFRSSQQRGRAICRPQGDEGVGCGNELSMVGQSREEGFWEDREVPTTAVGAYQTVPRLQDRSAERHQGRFFCSGGGPGS